MARLSTGWVVALGAAAAALHCGGEVRLGAEFLAAAPDAAPDGDGLPPVVFTGTSWCASASWNGGPIPDATTDVTIPSGAQIIVDCDAVARRIEIAPGGTLVVSRTASTTLTVHGNLVVRGTLNYGSPRDRVRPEATAQIVFRGMNDGNVVGDPELGTADGVLPRTTNPVVVRETDVGLWVMGAGIFSAAGTPKAAWSRLTEGVAAGQNRFVVEDASGWAPGDRVVLTPTETNATPEHVVHFDEATIASVAANAITIAEPSVHPHAGCAGCARRGEAANLTRNVIVRSFDDSAHAHVLAAARGVVQLDGVQLRWLGVQAWRRSALTFLRTAEPALSPFVRHVAIWGGRGGFFTSDESSGITVQDVAGYDTVGNSVQGGFSQFSVAGCENEWHALNDCPSPSPRGILFRHVLAAKVAPNGGSNHGIVGGAWTGSGAVDSVATGIGGRDSSGFFFGSLQQPAGRDRAFTGNTAHNNEDTGIRLIETFAELTPTWSGVSVWSNRLQGIYLGGYGNAYNFGDVSLTDNGETDLRVVGPNTACTTSDGRTCQTDPPPPVRLDGARLGTCTVGAGNRQTVASVWRNVTFTGERPVAIIQDHTPCSGGNGDDPNDGTCGRIELLLDGVSFPAGVKPFEFGVHRNRHTVWRVRSFRSADPAYTTRPTSFDLYRADNQVPGGAYDADFDAWLVPR